MHIISGFVTLVVNDQTSGHALGALTNVPEKVHTKFLKFVRVKNSNLLDKTGRVLVVFDQFLGFDGHPFWSGFRTSHNAELLGKNLGSAQSFEQLESV